jgi:hypothetical protein
MKSIFTIHVGEYLVGSHIEQELRFPNGHKVNVWIPSKDTGIDLLVTDRNNINTTSLQVKFSKDFLTTNGRFEYQNKLISCGWWTLNRDKIRNSRADYWIFALPAFNATTNMQYIILTPQQLLERLDLIHPNAKSLQTYIWVSSDGKCWETRGLRKQETDKIVLQDHSIADERDFTEFLNNWDVLFSKWKEN